MALFPVARPDFWTFAGVSRTLNVTYLRPIPVGETVIIECEVIAIGKRMGKYSYISCVVLNRKLICVCSHDHGDYETQVGWRSHVYL